MVTSVIEQFYKTKISTRKLDQSTVMRTYATNEFNLDSIVCELLAVPNAYCNL